MAITEPKDFVLAPKGTIIANGVVSVCILGTREYLFAIPLENISGSGTTVNQTKYSINNQDVLSGIKSLLEDPEIDSKQLQITILKLLSDWGLDQSKHAFEIANLMEFNIKAGFFSKGIYLKSPTDKFRQGIAVSGKDQILKFKNFYGR
jgi:hypothetical protein